VRSHTPVWCCQLVTTVPRNAEITVSFVCFPPVTLGVRRVPPTLRSLELRRSGTSSGAPPPHLRALLAECALEDVRRLKCAEHTIPVSRAIL
jgi:hypothetical protein